ncbi:MAG TPA: hypothetical protein VMW30_00495 [Candidatus Paceibacterota bacterium]|nr:hypothetical protein [Candidatus Paceibacterota bacterium]
MSTSRNHENQIDNYLSQVELSLNVVRDDERADILNEIREILQAKRLEADDADFSPVEALGDPALFANQWLEAAGYTSPLPKAGQRRSKNILYAALLVMIALAVPFRIWPTISNSVNNILQRATIFGFSVLFLYAFLIVIFILRALGKSITDVMMSFSARLKRSISRSSTGTHLLNSFDQVKPVWWVLRAWTLAILISYQRDSFGEKRFYPIPSWDGRRSIGLLLFIALVVGSFFVGNHLKATKRNFWYLPLLVSNLVLIAMFSMIVFSQADYNNTKKEVQVLVKVILGTQIGANCTLENEATNKPGISGGMLICLRTPRGLVWSDFNNLTADKYLNSVLPSCNTPYQKSLLTPGMIQLAENYYKDRNLLPVKVTMWGEANRALFAEGIRPCSNGIGSSVGAYSGFIPKEASAGWSIIVVHKANEFGKTNFLSIVKVGSTYKVMDVGTSP